ncbi:capsular polysaccharide biosynthesis protein [Aliiroseovarius lamellibrachiae]|uniref:capsular polysaccharide biosynthesis protein n=1 Tax=Aliiroseovarius lamellibrachiae TaxID=1924933 RepID=UPI001BE0E6F1|nr:capsular polysaccharide biosynthesis protein [Aliiroseovarius lamellibrachiae]MBT2130964.1 capsular polysaccharide biosynthesis protein [Aliiroseovarius lamellibrachiae]
MDLDLKNTDAAREPTSRRLYVYNGGFLTQPRIRRILDLAGWDIQLGLPKEGDWVGTWGKSPTSGRGEKVSNWKNSPVLRVEDAFLRSVLPGRGGEGPLGLMLDDLGMHFDSSTPSRLETILATDPLDNSALLNRARDAMARIQAAHLSKYNAFDPALPPPTAPYVLVIDQTYGDASVAHSGASEARFREMLVEARLSHPHDRIYIKSHPETQHGHRGGYYGVEDENDQVTLITDPISPWELLAGAKAVYTVSSGMGFEAVLAGHKPRVFGQPFYAGWGLTEDEHPVDRRQRKLTRAQLFAAAMILFPTWYDPHRDQLCELETVIDMLEARSRAWREDHRGYVATGMRLWKRKPLAQFFHANHAMIFDDRPERAAKGAYDIARPLMVWAGKERPEHSTHTPPLRIEDGFLRSRGLGAALTPPLSLVRDDLGIYYDPTRESRLERFIAASPNLPTQAHVRADRLITRLTQQRIGKYNLACAAPDLSHLPKGKRILVPGQVEDDASIQLGTTEVSTNLALLQRTRADNPNAVIIYKPHPDVEAGLRDGQVAPEDLANLADFVAHDADHMALIGDVDEVWTMTSTLGFEALIRKVPVTCLGAPFYAGWGLTRDLGQVPARRHARPSLTALVHATLLDYPRYFDPKINAACPVEVVVDRLVAGDVPAPGRANRILAKLQGIFASYAHLWRR